MGEEDDVEDEEEDDDENLFVRDLATRSAEAGPSCSTDPVMPRYKRRCFVVMEEESSDDED